VWGTAFAAIITGLLAIAPLPLWVLLVALSRCVTPAAARAGWALQPDILW
jgi:hypothetical protein